MVHSFIRIKVTILFLDLNLFIDYEEELMVAYLPHNRCSKFSVTSSAQLPMAFVYSNYFFPYVHIGSETKRGLFFIPLQNY